MTVKDLQLLKGLKDNMSDSGVISKGDVLKLESGMDTPVISSNMPINTFTTAKSKTGFVDASNIIDTYLEDNKDLLERVELPVDVTKRLFNVHCKISSLVMLLTRLSLRVNDLEVKVIPSEYKWSVGPAGDDDENINDIRTRQLTSYITYGYGTLCKMLTGSTFNDKYLHVISELESLRTMDIASGVMLTPTINMLIEGSADYKNWVTKNVTVVDNKVSDIDNIFANLSKVITEMERVKVSINDMISSLNIYTIDDYASNDSYSIDYYGEVADSFESKLFNLDYEKAILRTLIAITSN